MLQSYQSRNAGAPFGRRVTSASFRSTPARPSAEDRAKTISLLPVDE
jgi:hypothetical protein